MQMCVCLLYIFIHGNIGFNGRIPNYSDYPWVLLFFLSFFLPSFFALLFFFAGPHFLTFPGLFFYL